MASLLPYADAVMQQRLLASTQHEKLTKQLSDLQLTLNRQCLSLPDKLAAVESESDDLHEQRERKQRLVNELAQYRLELHTRTMGLTGAGKKRDDVRDFFAQVEAAFVSYPANIVRVARALQERQAVQKLVGPFIACTEALHARLGLLHRLRQHEKAARLIVAQHAQHLATQTVTVQCGVEDTEARLVDCVARTEAVVTHRGQVSAALQIAAQETVVREAELAVAQLHTEALDEWRDVLKTAAQTWADRLAAQSGALEQAKDLCDATVAKHTAVHAACTQAASEEAAVHGARAAQQEAWRQTCADVEARRDAARARTAALATQRAGLCAQASAVSAALDGVLQLLQLLPVTQESLFAPARAVGAAQRADVAARLAALRHAHEAHLAAVHRERLLARDQQALAAVEAEEARQRRTQRQEEATEWLQWTQSQREARTEARTAQATREAAEAEAARAATQQKKARRAAAAKRAREMESANDGPSVRDVLGRSAPRAGPRARPPLTAFTSRLQRRTEVASVVASASSAESAGRGVSDSVEGGGGGLFESSFNSTDDTITVTKARQTTAGGGGGGGGGVRAAPRRVMMPSPSPGPRTPRDVLDATPASRVPAKLGGVASGRRRKAGATLDQGPLPAGPSARAGAVCKPRAHSGGTASVLSGSGALSHALDLTKPTARKTQFSRLRPTVVVKHLSQASLAGSGDNIFTDVFSCN